MARSDDYRALAPRNLDRGIFKFPRQSDSIVRRACAAKAVESGRLDPLESLGAEVASVPEGLSQRQTGALGTGVDRAADGGTPQSASLHGSRLEQQASRLPAQCPQEAALGDRAHQAPRWGRSD